MHELLPHGGRCLARHLGHPHGRRDHRRQGARYEQSIQTLRAQLPFRMWKSCEGEFCGAQLRQGEGYTTHASRESSASGVRLSA